MPRADYPATVAECLDGRARYRRGVVGAAKAFAREGPWPKVRLPLRFGRHEDAGRGTLEERAAKFRRLNVALARAYGVPEPVLRFENINGSFSGASTCRRGRPGEPAAITLRGRLSVVTFLHEFAHALGRDERGACRWSINLFRRVFPEQYARLRADGHSLRRR